MPHNYLRPEWDRLAPAARVVYYDQRGCGRSPHGGDLSVAQHVRDLDSLVQKVRRVGPVFLAGSSWGSQLALRYTLDHPNDVAGLVLSGLVPWMRRPPSERAEVPDSVLHFTPEQLRALPERLDSIATQEQLEPLDPGIRTRIYEYCVRAALSILDDARRHFPEFEALRALQLPVLILRGTIPEGMPEAADAYAALLPAGWVLDVAGAGHDPWFDAPDRVFPAVSAFITTTVLSSMPDAGAARSPR
jgi:proline iminopeptidase